MRRLQKKTWRPALRNIALSVVLFIAGAAASAADPATAPAPGTRADARPTGPVDAHRCASAQTPKTARNASRARESKSTSPYGDQYRRAGRLQSEIERYARMIGCQPPLSEAYGAREMWQQIDAADDEDE